MSNSNLIAIEFRLTQLDARLRRQLHNMGWSDACIYDRDWKKKIKATMKEISVLKKSRKHFA